MDAQYVGLSAGYGVAAASAWALWASNRVAAMRISKTEIKRPWIEIGLLLAAVAAVIGLGQIYLARRLLDPSNPLTETLNQLFIYAPILVVLALRPNPFRTAFLAPEGWPGLFIGVALAGLALVAFVYARGTPRELVGFLRFLPSAHHLPHLMQVLLQDIAIAAFLARFSAALGRIGATTLVALLFEASHAPAKLAQGATLQSLGSLAVDTVLAVTIFSAVIVTRSIWWFIPVHLALDMTQLYPAFAQ